MSIKLILGIVFPIIVIAGSIIIDSMDIGIAIESKTINSVDFTALFSGTSPVMNNIPIRNITIRNDYFTPKKIHLPTLIVCLNDKDNLKIRQNFNVMYSEGISEKEQKIYPQASSISESIRGYYPSHYATAKDVEVPSHSKKEVKVLINPINKVLINPINIYNYNKGIDYHYDEFEELLLIELKDKETYYNYNSCQNIESKDLDNAVRINISGREKITELTINPVSKSGWSLKTNFNCTDSDGDKDYHTKGYITGVSRCIYGDVTQDCTRGIETLSDRCRGETELLEYFCGEDGRITVETVKCPSKCDNGICI